jgi:hypothetical protein
MDTWVGSSAVSPEGLSVGWYCGNYNQLFVAAACAYPTNKFLTFGEGGGVGNPPLGATVTCSGSTTDMYAIDPEGGTSLDLLAYIIRWNISANYSGLCHYYMTILEVRNKDNAGGPPVPPPPSLTWISQTRAGQGGEHGCQRAF